MSLLYYLVVKKLFEMFLRYTKLFFPNAFLL